MAAHTSLRDRFASKWTPVPETGCWLWEAARDKNGYGLIQDAGKLKKAHRVSWLIHKGDIPKGLGVLHKCDTPPCVNPDHLFTGTNKDNQADCSAKGRHKSVLGSAHVNAVLSEDDVREIRKSNDSQTSIASRFGITQSLVSMIKLGKRWGHLK